MLAYAQDAPAPDQQLGRVVHSAPAARPAQANAHAAAHDPPGSWNATRYRIRWDSNGLLGTKRNVQLSDWQDNLKFVAHLVGKVWQVTRTDGGHGNDELVGMLKSFAGQNRWVYTRTTANGGDENAAESFGICFTSRHPRQGNIVLRTDDHAVADRDLSKMAEANAVPAGFSLFHTAVPWRNAQGRLVLHFGTSDMEASRKNVLIAGADGRNIFALTRSPSQQGRLGRYNYRDPFQEETAFALGLVFIVSRI
jgi:hypothetical protein